MERVLDQAGIGYRSLVELGNLFLDLPDWQDRYRSLLEKAGELLVARLDVVPQPLCLLCSEKRVVECHRRHIAEFLATTRGAELHHIE